MAMHRLNPGTPAHAVAAVLQGEGWLRVDNGKIDERGKLLVDRVLDRIEVRATTSLKEMPVREFHLRMRQAIDAIADERHEASIQALSRPHSGRATSFTSIPCRSCGRSGLPTLPNGRCAACGG